MPKRATLYVLVDETGMDLGYFTTLKAVNAEHRDWVKTGTEPTVKTISYTPNRKGVAALLNSLKQEAG